MNNLIELNDCVLLGYGAEGSVYLTPEGFALKRFNTIKAAKKEVAILDNVKDSRFFPNVIIRISNIVVREYVQGDNLSEYLKANGLSYSLSIELIELIEDLKRLKFKRINIRNAHIFIDKNQKVMVIDPRKPYTKVTPYPKNIVKILLKQNLFDTFLKNVLLYRPDLLDYWIDAHNFVINKYRHLLRYA
ncbi:serine/threonine protein kinase [Clostridium sp.]|uniref:serine/threonine protein kinase n=1 Tax=Clostridium sp. TaxID=1506 RepID=UPI0026058DF7|nr:serine/threonine protein kinase [Clostridium sp.]